MPSYPLLLKLVVLQDQGWSAAGPDRLHQGCCTQSIAIVVVYAIAVPYEPNPIILQQSLHRYLSNVPFHPVVSSKDKPYDGTDHEPEAQWQHADQNSS
jgi:hypothetical protein